MEVGCIVYLTWLICVLCVAQVVRATVVAALELDYPKDKLTVCLCDDGNRPGTHQHMSIYD
jgi:cellulose synthase/poly-beta-1,6-N-acetylglucosamine synthase-like glycosyltransferase